MTSAPLPWPPEAAQGSEAAHHALLATHLDMSLANNPSNNVNDSLGSNVVVFEQIIDVDEDVKDFFNSRFSTREDLSKIRSVLHQQTEIGYTLRQKLEESKVRTAQVLEQAQDASRSTQDRLRHLEASAVDLEGQIESSEAFAAEKNKRDQRSLIESLDDLRRKVQALEDAKTYILAVSRTQRLISEARELLQTSAEQALVPYNSLVQMSTNIKGVLGGRGTKLESFLDTSRDALLKELKAHLSKKFQASLDALGWPKPITDPFALSDDQKDDFEHAFKQVLLLQRPMYGELDRSGEKPFPPLLTTELMAAPLIMRFKFHFDGKRSTNRLDKPEWYLTHILELIKDHTPFIQDYVQSVVEDTEFKDYDIKNDFIRVLLKAVQDKIRFSVPDMLSVPEILSHAIRETLQFDKVLRDTEFYMPPGQTTEWHGTVDVYLGNREWLKTWLRVEKEFAKARYTQIMEDEDAWQPAYEDLGDKDYIMPTKSAEKLSDLLEIITGRYRPLPKLEHRTFMLDIQLDLLIAYHRYIRVLVDQYESLSYSFVRVMPGTVSAEERNSTGIDGLCNLCHWLASVEYFSSTLKDWSEDVFFLELHKEILDRTQKISNPLHSDNEASEDEDIDKMGKEENGTIFDKAIKGFETLSKRIQELVVRNITKDVFSAMKPYVSLRSWPQIELSNEGNGFPSQPSAAALSTSGQYENDDVSPELYQPLTVLSHSFEYLATALPTRHFTMLYRQTSLEIQDFFWQKIIMKNSFSELGGMQFARDFRIGLMGASRRWVKKPENYHRKLRDAAVLLSLQSAKANSQQQGRGGQDGSQSKKTLAQVMVFLFDDDLESEAVKSKLEEIGVMHLGVSDARDVIRRRVECWR